MTRKKRDYEKEYRDYHGKPEHIEERSMRNKARREMGLEVGDPREVDHVIPLSKGGDNSRDNLRVVSREENRAKGAKMPGEIEEDNAMGNRNRFKAAWKKHRDEVIRLRTVRDKELSKLESHKGSEYGRLKGEEVEKRFADGLAASRAAFGEEADEIVAAMHQKANELETSVTPPSDEQLRLLQAFSMMDELDVKDYRAAMKACSDSNIAQKTLYQLGRSRVKGAPLQEPVSIGSRAHNQVNALTREARHLMKWDGTQRGEALSKSLDERRAGVPSEMRAIRTSSADAGSIDPTSDSFEHDLIGMAYDADALAAVD